MTSESRDENVNADPGVAANKGEDSELTDQERCMLALLDLRQAGANSQQASVNRFFTLVNGSEPPGDLLTHIQVWPKGTPALEGFKKTYPNILAAASVGFESRQAGIKYGNNLYLYFLRNPDGIAMVGDYWQDAREGRHSEVVATYAADYVKALEEDAKRIAGMYKDAKEALAELGSLEGRDYGDGTKDFHLGDVISLIVDRRGPRGTYGLMDILSYMTAREIRVDEMEEYGDMCAAALREEFGDTLEPYLQDLATRHFDSAGDYYRWIKEVAGELSPFLRLRLGMADVTNMPHLDGRTQALFRGVDLSSRSISFRPGESGGSVGHDPSSPNP